MTDKEVAEKLRYVAEYNLSNTHLIDLADELDPPGPEIPDGHIWYRYIGATPQEWSPGLQRVDKVVNQYGQQLLPDSRLEVIPARTVQPGSVVLPLRDAQRIWRGTMDQPERAVLGTAIKRAEQEVS